MSFQNAYLNSVMDDLRARYAHEPEYLQACLLYTSRCV